MNDYLVTGTFRKIDITENFQIERSAPSSRHAYVKVRDDFYNGGCKTVHVVAIKMKCTHCGKLHITVDPNLWLQ